MAIIPLTVAIAIQSPGGWIFTHEEMILFSPLNMNCLFSSPSQNPRSLPQCQTPVTGKKPGLCRRDKARPCRCYVMVKDSGRQYMYTKALAGRHGSQHGHLCSSSSFPNSASHKGAFMAEFLGMVSFLVVSVREAETPVFLSSQPHKGEFMRFPVGRSILRFKGWVEGSLYHA